ncbi:MAG: glycosyltransferase family 4 protein [Alistipes sp.]|nr:glycosyltransferase family 4 protein [Alistipes sp.]
MKLFLVSNMYPDNSSPGYGVFVKNVADYLCDNGVYIPYRAVIRGRSKNVIHKLVKYIVFYCTIVMHFFKKYDALYIHYPNMVIPVLFPLFKLCKRNLIVNYHGEDLLYSGRLGTILGQITEKFVKEYATAVVVPSDFFKQILLNRSICTEEKIIVFPSGGVNTNIFYPSSKEKLDSLELGFVGRIEYGKGWKEYILTLSNLKKYINFNGYIIGYGALEHEMKELISQCGLNDKIKLINGIPQSKLQYYYSMFDLLLFTTQLPESLGLVGLEAMACGTPIIATNIGGVATYTKDNVNGFLVEKGDINGIVNSVERYVHMSDAEKKQMRCNCIETAKKYSTDTIYISFLNNLKKQFNS